MTLLAFLAGAAVFCAVDRAGRNWRAKAEAERRYRHWLTTLAKIHHVKFSSDESNENIRRSIRNKLRQPGEIPWPRTPERRDR